MYTPAPFAETDPATLAAVIDAHPLAVLVAQGPAGLVANHIPLLRDGSDLVGHVALANDLHRDLAPGAPVLAVFGAGDAYVSPNWYPSKAATHRAVPTWNYRVVHAHGTIAFSHAEADKRRAVHLLTRAMEGRVNGARGWRMGDAPPDYKATMLAGIVAFRIRVARLDGKSKLSQNRDAPDRSGAAEGIAAQGGAAVAAMMRTRG